MSEGKYKDISAQRGEKVAYMVSQTPEGYWYAHMNGYSYIPVAGSFGSPFKDTKEEALRVAAACMGLSYEEYMALRSGRKQTEKTHGPGSDDVRKETAKEILQAVYNEWFRSETIDLFVKNLAKKYGVEVDE